MGTFRPKEVFEQAQAEEQNGNTRVAATHYASLALYLRRKGKLREARKLLLKAIQLHPSSARLYLHLASVEAGLGTEGVAITSMRAFCSTASVRGKLREYEKQVLELLEKQPSLVAVFYTKWLETDRTEPRVLLAASRVLEKSSDVKGALERVREAFILAPNDSKIRAAVRGLLERQLDTVRLHAWEGFESGRIDKEQMISVLSENGGGVEPSSSPIHSKAALDKSFTLDKSLSSMIASLEEQLGEIGGVTPQAEPVSDMQPIINEFRRHADTVLGDDEAGRWDLAHALAEMGLSQEAIEELKKIPPQSDWYVRALLKTAEILTTTESYLGALENLQKVLRHEPQGTSSHSEALYQMASTYMHLGDGDQALRMLDLLEQGKASYRDSRSLRTRIQEARLKRA
jgi:tetratricopeptide (TPR) repeat protein